MRILLVEDDARLVELIDEVLCAAGFAVDRASDGEAADQAMAVFDYDLVVLDWEIPRPSGLELLKRWRAAGRDLPILMLTARASVDDRVGGLDSGADDYLIKPFSFAELIARVRSLIRRRQKPLDLTLKAGELIFDRAAQRVTVGGQDVELTLKELQVLEYLLVHRERVVSRTELEEHAWDSAADPMANVVDVIIHRLRRKLGATSRPPIIRTLRGVGYQIAEPS